MASWESLSAIPIATTFLKGWESASRPRAVKCSDEQIWVLKGVAHARRQAVNDRVVGALGALAGAPVGVVGLVDVRSEFIAGELQMSHFAAGLAHGTVFLEGVSDDKEGVAHVDEPANRERFALLACLFGWVGSNDAQFLYSKQPPRLVHSVDHGHFFPNGPDWSIASLEAAPQPSPDAIASACGLTQEELEVAISTFAAIPDANVARIVDEIPSDWGVAPDERASLKKYLLDRKRAMFGRPPLEA